MTGPGRPSGVAGGKSAAMVSPCRIGPVVSVVGVLSISHGCNLSSDRLRRLPFESVGGAGLEEHVHLSHVALKVVVWRDAGATSCT